MLSRWGIFIAFGLTAAPAWAQESAFSGSAIVTSDYVSRGISQTQRKPALQLDLAYGHASGAYAGIFASNVDYTPAGTDDDGIDVEIVARGGWRWPVAGQVALDLSIEHARYPGAIVADYDYTEYGIAVEVGEHVALRVAHAPDYYGLGGAATDYGADLGWSVLDDRVSLALAVGYHDQDALASDGYGYLDVSASRQFGRVRLEAGVARAFGYSPALAEINGALRLADAHGRLALALEF